MRVASKLMLSLLAFSVLPLILLGWFVSSQVNRARESAISRIQVAAQESVEEMRGLSRRAARDKAEAIAREVADYLARHPDAPLANLGKLDTIRQAARDRSALDSESDIELILHKKPVPIRELVARAEGRDPGRPVPAAGPRPYPSGYTYVADVEGTPVKVAVRLDDSGIKKPVDELARILRTIAEQTEHTTHRAMDDLRLMLAIGVGAIVVGLTLVVGQIAPTVTRPIHKLTAAAERIRRGERDVDLDVGGSREVRLLAHAFERATSELRQYAESLEQKNLELDVAHKMATQAAQDLQNALDQMVQSEKMSGLGRLVAEMADETSTSHGAINRMTPDAVASLDDLVDGLRRLHKMTPDEFHTFGHFLDRAAARQLVPAQTDTHETAELQLRLKEDGIPNAAARAELLARCRIPASDAPELCRLLDKYDVGEVFSALVEIHATSKISRSSTDKIAQIAQALKFYSSRGQATLSPAANVNQTLRDALVLVHNRLKTRAEVELDLAEDLPPVPVSGGSLTDVWTEILSHACDTMDDPAPQRGRVRVRTWLEEEAVHVAISDNGRPLPAAAAARLGTASSGRGASEPGESDLAAIAAAVKRYGGSLDARNDDDGFKTVDVALLLEACPAAV
jgi:signal transduction histidine kinase